MWALAHANGSPKPGKAENSGRQLTPLGQGGGAVLFEDGAAGEVAIETEMVVDRGVNGGEFLQGPDVPEFRHGTLSSSNGWCEFSARLLRLRPPFREIKARGYAGGETRLKQFVRGLAPVPTSPPIIRFETEPGHQMQADWATVGRGADMLKVFIATLGVEPGVSGLLCARIAMSARMKAGPA